MNFSDSMRFPYPVLQKDSDDYIEGNFDLTLLKIMENPEKATLAVRYKAELEEPSMRQLVADGLAGAGIYVTCQETYFSELMELSLGELVHEFPAGMLNGRVIIRPLVWAKKIITDFPTDNFHEEFGESALTFPAGAILALGEEFTISAGHEKLRDMETIFALALSDKLDPGTLDLDLDGDHITVLVATDIYEFVNHLRGLGYGKAIILNSIFLPAVMQTLSALRDGDNIWAEKRWHQIFVAKCDHFGIDLENDEIWKATQTLLKAPFNQVFNHPEFRKE